jgi:hypothetical protein
MNKILEQILEKQATIEMPNKYLTKLSGLPIIASNLGQVAKTLSNKTLLFNKNPGMKSLAKMTSTADRLNAHTPVGLKPRLNQLVNSQQGLKYSGK